MLAPTVLFRPKTQLVLMRGPNYPCSLKNKLNSALTILNLLTILKTQSLFLQKLEIIYTDPSQTPASLVPPKASLPPWLSYSNLNPPDGLCSPSVALSLSPSTNTAVPTISWLQSSTNLPPQSLPGQNGKSIMVPEFLQCCRELEESHHALTEHTKQTAWRLKRVEMQLESEKASRKRQKIEEIEAKIMKITDEERSALERIEMEYREQLAGLRRESEAKEQKLSEQWASKHLRLTKLLRQDTNCSRLPEANVRRL